MSYRASMKTLVTRIDDDLHLALKRAAVEKGTTIQDLVAEALRRMLKPKAKKG